MLEISHGSLVIPPLLGLLTLSQRDPINVWRARNTDFAHSYLRFGACYVDENTTIRFSETISPNSYR